MNTATHYVFVDFENVPRINLDPVKGQPVHVTLLIGKQQKKLELTLVRQIHELSSQVELIEVGASGRNALDFTLAWYLGRASLEAPKAHFYVVSRDRDFDPLISHLKAKGFTVSRHDSIAALPLLNTGRRARSQPEPARPAPKPAAPQPKPRQSPPARKPAAASRSTPAAKSAPAAKANTSPPAASKSSPDRRDKIISRLSDPQKRNRPATHKALLAQVKNSLGKEASDAAAEDIVRELVNRESLQIDDRGRITYRGE